MHFTRSTIALMLVAALAAAPTAAVGQLIGRPSETASVPGVHGTAQHILAIRNGPGKSYTKLGEFPKGTSLVFLSPPGCMNGYCFVQGPNGKRGWILKEAATTSTSATAASRSDIAGYGISQNKLHLRSGPSQQDILLGTIAIGETMHMLKHPPCRNGYCFIETSKGQRGWILRSAVSIHNY